MSAQIVAIRGPLTGRTFPLTTTPLSLGRTPENVVVLASGMASRRHAEIRAEGGAFVLYDLGSSNGTRVNGQPIQMQRLNPGDLFEIGDESFRFELAATDAPTVVAGSAHQPPPPPPAPRGNPTAQQPLPPPPTPHGGPAAHQQPFPPPPPPPPAQPARRWPLLLAVALLLSCTLLAALVGGITIARTIDWSGTSVGGTGGSTNGGGQVPAPVPTLEPTRVPLAADAAKWTVLVYMAGDNDLESAAITDFHEMARVGSSDELNLVVQFDRIRSREFWNDSSAGDWETTKRFLVERGMQPTPDMALADMGELNMGDPAVLADFIEWGITNYPAERYALVLWDHGAAWFGVASDDTDEDMLTLPDISAALENARARTGFGRLDLIGFDACLMAQLDVFHAVAPYADVVVASADLEPNQGWDWEAWVQRLADDPSQDAHAVARAIVETYMVYYPPSRTSDLTLSAFDLTRIDEINEPFERLNRLMIEQVSGRSYNAIAQSRAFTDVYVPTSAELFSAVDLGHFAQLLAERSTYAPMTQAANDLAQAIENTRIANGTGSFHPNSTGISIYFPDRREYFLQTEYGRASPLPRNTSWDTFLDTFYEAGLVAVTRPEIRDLSLSALTVAEDDPVTLEGVVSGQDIAYVFSFIGIPNASRDTIELIYVNFIYPPDSIVTLGDQPVWDEGAYNLRLRWNARNWYMNNGRDKIEVLLGPIRYGSDLFGVEGVYTSQATGEKINAGLIFRVSENQGTLERIWGFPGSRDDRQEPQPFELTPAPGDTFTAYMRTYTDTGTDLEPGSVQGNTLTFTNQPFTVGFDATISGDYVMGFLVRDIAGNFNYDYEDIRVVNP
ncbi:clostripain-related cysteine peptidase [Candidatus Viridilinea mediisalina]|uniref:Forkhead-associated protein n=1 Tax=Candidatus Viridilinea mediisalina TaxID=2024553 RepID=A0A2A6RLU3_9CHLR|nr:clostripain-related cysteine peptidase [Candidatus Viridilinea mediisalina]PDW03871.1 forkhead-associated protein [Candidatus Viridilinea mediisalina]